MPRSVHATKEYGKLRFHLSERMVEQGLNRNQIAQAIGSRFEVVDKWCSDGPERIDADVLDCKVEDLLQYKGPDQ